MVTHRGVTQAGRLDHVAILADLDMMSVMWKLDELGSFKVGDVFSPVISFADRLPPEWKTRPQFFIFRNGHHFDRFKNEVGDWTGEAITWDDAAFQAAYLVDRIGNDAELINYGTSFTAIQSQPLFLSHSLRPTEHGPVYVIIAG
jgi:hypothetical protein